MKPNFIYFDTEFHSVQEKEVVPVCLCASDGTEIWTHQQPVETLLVCTWFLQKKEQGAVFVCHSAIAESRYLHACGVPWSEIHSAKFLDTYVLAKQMQNCNNKYQYGRYLKDGPFGKVAAKSVPPKMDSELNKGVDNTEVGASYAQVVFNLTGKIVDTRRKDHMRDIIISANTDAIEANRREILEYCASDIEHLPAILEAMWGDYSQYFISGEEAYAAMFRHGRYMTDCARMESVGLPFDLEAARNLGRNFSRAKDAIVERCNKVYPFYVRDTPTRGHCKGEWVFKMERFEKFLMDNDMWNDWPRTDTKRISTKSEVLDKNRSIPEIGMLYETQNSLKQIGWFRPEGADNIYKSVGSDGRLRVFFNPFGTQTGRNAPSPKRGFIFAMASWLRVLLRPGSGRSCYGIDDVGQEVALMGYVTGDDNLVNTYYGGDVYMGFGYLSGMIPPGGKKGDYPTERQVCKACLSGDTLIRTKKGLKPIPYITEEDYLWDGTQWVKSQGVIYNGKQKTIIVEGIRATPDHLIYDGEKFVEAEKWGRDFRGRAEDAYRDTEFFSPSWAEVWELGCGVLRSAVKKWWTT